MLLVHHLAGGWEGIPSLFADLRRLNPIAEVVGVVMGVAEGVEGSFSVF